MNGRVGAPRRLRFPADQALACLNSLASPFASAAGSKSQRGGLLASLNHGADCSMMAASPNPASRPMDEAFAPAFTARELSFSALPGFDDDDFSVAFRVFVTHAKAALNALAPLRPARSAPRSLQDLFLKAASLDVAADPHGARAFFTDHFRPFLILPRGGSEANSGFFTGYYEPVVAASLTPSPDFPAAILGRPDDLIALPHDHPSGFAARRATGNGTFEPYPDRAAIAKGALANHAVPVAYVRDEAEAFLIHVQGSARLELPDGSAARLVYAGRNGRPYRSIGRILIERGDIAPEAMSLSALKGWIRAHGQKPGEAGLALLHENPSYIFFRLERFGLIGKRSTQDNQGIFTETGLPSENTLEPATREGPIGGAGLSLTPLRSIAIDRSLWPYGTPIWVDAEFPWDASLGADPPPTPFRRLMIAEDTGSAIIGPARADLFMGSGAAAGDLAGRLRHSGHFIVLWPHGEEIEP